MKFSEYPYERINMEEVGRQLTELLDRLENSVSSKEFKEIWMQIQKISDHIMTESSIASVRHEINTADPFYEKEIEFWDETMPLLEAYSTRQANILLSQKDREELYDLIPEVLFQQAECRVRCFDEKIIPLLQKENSLSTEYGKLKASAQIELDGKIYNLGTIGRLMQDKDRDLRKRATDAAMGFYREKEAEFDRIYDELVKTRDQIAKELGFKDFVELGYLRMTRLDYDRKMVENYRRQILEDVVPLDRELYERQRKRLGLDRLRYYDESFEFESGNPEPKGTSEQLIQAAVKMYHEMSEETGRFIDRMVNDEMWDLLAKDNKALGGFCTSFEDYKSPFIFANFNGTSGDVDVLTHEAGHAFQYTMSTNIPCTDARWPTMESAEIHSMSMEFFAYPWMKEFFKEDTNKYYYYHFTSALKFLPYGILIDHFQHEVYEHPEMTPAERKACFRRLEKMYCPHKDYEGCDLLEEGGWWYRQGHVFQSPFYYIDYTLAQVCAFQFWDRQYRRDPKAFEDYLHLCSLGGSLSFLKLVKEAGLKSPFEDGCVRDVVKDAREFLAGFDDMSY